jgi:hypothetical protein
MQLVQKPFTMIKITAPPLLQLLAACLLSCPVTAQQETDTVAKRFDYGTTEGNTYTNAYFGFSLDLPETWNADSIRHYKNPWPDLTGLLRAGTPYSSDLTHAAIHILAERADQEPDAHNAADYLDRLRKRLVEQGSKPEDFQLVQTVLAGRSCFRLTEYITQELPGLKSEKYVFLDEGYWLVLIRSWSGGQRNAELDAMIATFKWTVK